MSKLLTAIDIENNNKNISDIVENNLVIYNRKRIAIEKKRVRDLRRIELNDDKYDLTKDELLKITTEIVNSEESTLFKEHEFVRVLDEKDNYLEFRKNIDSLNDLVYESVDVEKNEIQTISNFRKYRDLVLHSMQYNNLMFLIIRTKSKIVDSYIDNIFDTLIRTENFDITTTDKEKLNNKLIDTCFNIMLKIRKMYNIDINTDDFDIFDEYGMETNIDYSHQLSDLIFKSLKLGYKNTNILNELSNKKILGRWIIYNQIITNKLFGILFSSKFISNNAVTILENSYTNNVNREYVYRTRTIGELLLEITNEENLHISKIDRQQIYMTYDGLRPSKEEYYKWNGLQVFDIDLKHWIKKGNGDINLLKRLLHDYLSDFHWYLWIVKSASGNGLHIYTKIAPPHHVYLEAQKNEYISKYWFQVNYATKLSNIYDILYRLHTITDNNIDFTYFYKEKEGTVSMVPNNVKENMYVDNIVSRITAGIKLACDMEPLINNNFQDLHVGLGLSQTIDGFEFQQTIENVLFRECKQTTFIDEKLLFESQEDYEKSKIVESEIDLSKFVTLNIDATEIKVLPKSNINYITRYNVCNTLASLFGKEGLPIAHKILDSKGCNNVGEINAFYSCAVSNTKEPSKIGLEVLKKAGIIKNIEPELSDIVENNYKTELKQQLEKVLINTTANFDYHLSAKQYLSDIKEELNKRIVGDRVNIIFSPPGSGKCLGIDTPILMYNGAIKKVQDIVVGDVLMGWDSTPRNVLSTCTGQEELYRIIPNKGMSWVCNKSHILSLIESGKFVQNSIKPNKYHIEDINITQTLKLPKNHRKKLFRVGLNFDKKELLLSPYFLGLWLGDGTTLYPEIAIGDIDREITLPFLKSYAKKLGCTLSEYKDYRNNVSTFRIIYGKNKHESPIQKLMRHYNLLGNKHIPKDFLLNDRRNRLFLFAGLIDSDGGGSDGTYDYVTKLPQLAEDIKFLCRSLGYYVNHVIKIINDKPYQRLTISGDFSDVPVRLKRKKFTRQMNKNCLVTGFQIEPIGIGDYYGFQIDGDKRFLLGDFTVTHNTELIKGLAKEGKRVLLVLPYISVIRNKVETDSEISDYFDVFYGTKDIRDIEYGRNAVTTFDKFSRINYDKVSSMFDYIMIDESHLLFTSSYRIEATSNVIKKIKELFYISSNDPFAGKIVLMTGSSTGEEYFFDGVANIIRVTKPYLNKNMQFLICDDNLDAITRMASKTADYINSGNRIMIPTNKGEIYTEKIIGMIEYLLNRPVKYGYYKRSNTEQEICKLINEDNSVGDYEIIFCSNYLSVGVDINDKYKFVSLYLGNFSGYEIEQFNARIRKTGIDSFYCIVTSKSDGTTNDLLLNEPDLLLKITDDDKLFFIDDKEIAKAKTEFIASYDPVLHKITTPGFALINGKIQFSLEEYELIMFETKYNVCMEHPLRVARELSKYGYNINVSTEFDGLSAQEQENLKQMGLDSAKEEKIRKHNLLVTTFVDLVKINHYHNEHGLEYVNTIDWILKNTDSIVEDRDAEKSVTVVFDMFASPQQCIVKSREALDKIIKSARYLINRYSEVKAIEILYQYVDGSGILKQKNFQRAINLLKLIDNSESNELAEPIVKSLEKMYLFVDRFEVNKDYRIGYETYQKTLDMWTNEYIDMLGMKIVSKYGFEKIRDSLNEMLSDVATKSVSKNGVKFNYNRLPEQDSSTVLNKRSIDSIINNMFKITEELNVNRKMIRKKHVILTTQNF